MLVAVLSLLTLSLYAQPSTAPFWLGADISGTLQLEHRGTQLRNVKGEPRENTALMHELGLNAIRLRVWVNPSQGEFCSPHDVLVMARRAKDWGMPVMIGALPSSGDTASAHDWPSTSSSVCCA